ncbi:hypothetical protein [Scytonema sp. PCC 10023]|uniref:hypothetical protein n=1 Tax=Scytonema sp. PCC 10023 TaxID=1680591 RepID=UPI0039C620CC
MQTKQGNIRWIDAIAPKEVLRFMRWCVSSKQRVRKNSAPTERDPPRGSRAKGAIASTTYLKLSSEHFFIFTL